MTISIDHITNIISVEKSDMTQIQTVPFEVRELDLDVLHNELRTLEANPESVLYQKTHNHNTIVGVGGVTLARVVEILDPYTITFEDGQYVASLVGANSNVQDVANLNQVSIRSANSAGLIQVTSGSGVLPSDVTDIKNAVFNEVMENGLTYRQYHAIRLAALAGLSDGMDGTLGHFRNQADDLDRITVNFDQFGNRTSITFDLTDI